MRRVWACASNRFCFFLIRFGVFLHVCCPDATWDASPQSVAASCREASGRSERGSGSESLQPLSAGFEEKLRGKVSTELLLSLLRRPSQRIQTSKAPSMSCITLKELL